MHSCVIAYACDKPLLGTTVLAPPLSADPRGHLITSLDHSMWFHQPCRADEWFLMHLSTLATGRARAFVRADLYRSDGRLAVSATQQGLVRPLSPTLAFAGGQVTMQRLPLEHDLTPTPMRWQRAATPLLCLLAQACGRFHLGYG